MLYLFCRFYGQSSLKVATAFHLLARSYSCRGDFRTALGFEKSAYQIYNQRVSGCLLEFNKVSLSFIIMVTDSSSHVIYYDIVIYCDVVIYCDIVIYCNIVIYCDAVIYCNIVIYCDLPIL